ncbi:hypothetical protein [Methylobacterium sp. Leaf87]|uniref:hypothetical protein n=1 Tax=Methylobacterium sp. Leaf87 TaxID=1736243 RepID=UPI000A4F966B|nr:hypothetical protein [Methylobacterium sp. Leaf87]
MSSTADRIPNAPTLNEGMAICLSKAQHGSGLGGIHADLRKSLNNLGADYTPSETAPLGEIISAAKLSIGNIEHSSERCKDLANSKLSFQIGQKGLDSEQPGRTQEKPLPSGAAKNVLRRGYY